MQAEVPTWRHFSHKSVPSDIIIELLRSAAQFCNTPAQPGWLAGAWKAGQRRRWTQFPSIVATDMPCSVVRGRLSAQVDCRTESFARMIRGWTEVAYQS